MMNVTEAIELLAPFHNAQLVCVIHNEDGTITGQMSTGCETIPLIAVDHNQVHLEELLEVIEASANPSSATINLFNTEDDLCLFGLQVA